MRKYVVLHHQSIICILRNNVNVVQRKVFHMINIELNANHIKTAKYASRFLIMRQIPLSSWKVVQSLVEMLK